MQGGVARNRARIILNGPGRVGREFLRLIAEKASFLERASGFWPSVDAIVGRRQYVACPGGLNPSQAVISLDASGPVLGAGACSEPSNGLLRGEIHEERDPKCEVYETLLNRVADWSHPGDILIIVEATPTNLTDGEPGLSHITKGLKRGFSVVSLAKGPLVLALSELRALAEERGVELRYSGAVAAALPTLDTAKYALLGSDIVEIEGVLNGTTNYILNRMAEGESYERALRKAQEMGVAEADPSLDVEGYDSAAKLLIIANTVFGSSLTLDDVSRQGITHLDALYVAEKMASGTPVRLVARAMAKPAGDSAELALSVGPEPVPRGHPFAGLPGTSKAIRYRTVQMGDLVVSGGASDVTGAAASALKDVAHILIGSRRP